MLRLMLELGAAVVITARPHVIVVVSHAVALEVRSTLASPAPRAVGRVGNTELYRGRACRWGALTCRTWSKLWRSGTKLRWRGSVMHREFHFSCCLSLCYVQDCWVFATFSRRLSFKKKTKKSTRRTGFDDHPNITRGIKSVC